MPNKTYYDILEVSQTATQEEIKKAFRTQAKKWHPDAHVGESQEAINSAEGVMQTITVAYEVLSDLSLRQKYDTKLRQENRTTTAPTSPKSQSQYSYYTSYTITRDESEYDFDEWIKEYLRRERQKYSNINKEEFIKYDIEIMKILQIESLNNSKFNEDYNINEINNIQKKRLRN